MKALIIGHGNMVGHVVAQFFYENGHVIDGYDETVPVEIENICSKSLSGKIDDFNSIEKIVAEGKYDSIINCSAVINEDAESDKNKALNVNSILPKFLEYITKETKTVVVHRGTDCIFSGQKGNYSLDDWPDRDTFYGKTKALGEIVNEKDITIRLSLIGPEMDSSGTGLFNWFYNQKQPVNGFANAIWTGLTTVEFAREIEWLLKNNCHGIFQLVPSQSISKYELLTLFEHYYPQNREIVKIDNELVDRSLLQVKPKELNIPQYEEMISEMRTWTDNHKTLYRYL